MRTRVCISIDTEFSINCTFGNPALLPVAEQHVWCKVKDESHGLGFILDCLAEHKVTGTFFVETLNRHYFRHDPMRRIAERLHASGHDVQLHIHPCWDIFRHENWRELARGRQGLDDFHGRPEDESLRLIEAGLTAFHEWRLPAPSIFRSGNLHHDESLYRAQARAGIPFSSHVGMAIFDSGDPQFRLFSGRHACHGITECPILTFCDWKAGSREHLKTLTITGSSFAEMRMLLEQAHQQGMEQVVILTHPFEYVSIHEDVVRKMRRHRVNQRRLKKLCAFLDQNRDRFDACGMETAARAPMRAPSSSNVLLKGSLLHALPRMVEQKAYDGYSQWRVRYQMPSLAGPHEVDDSLRTARMYRH